MDINVKDGTPLNGPSLCDTCSLAFIARGYRVSELVVVCQATDPVLRIRFRVRDCSRYNDKTKSAIWEMEKIATVLDPKALKRDVGFLRMDETGADGDQVELVLDRDNE